MSDTIEVVGNPEFVNVYQIKTTDPVLGGPDGIANLQAKQLAERDAYLKIRTDEVEAARGEYGSLPDRLENYDTFDPAAQNALWGAACAALAAAGLANREALKTIRQRIQMGAAFITNRGVISGCVVSRSESAVRNISLSAGSIFMNGRMMPVTGQTNSALVPSNPGDVAKSCYAYLFIDANGVVQFTTTEFGMSVPSDGLPLYLITVPAGNTEANDPYLASVTFSDIRRIESGYPIYFSSLAHTPIALPYDMGGSDYIVMIEVLDSKGGWSQRSAVYDGEKASNGFKIFVEGSWDSVSARWAAIRLSL